MLVTRTPYTAKFNGSEANQTAHFILQRVGTRGGVGPISDAQRDGSGVGGLGKQRDDGALGAQMDNFSNILTATLALLTGVYVLLTQAMLREMRRTTRGESYKRAVDEIVSIKRTLVTSPGMIEVLAKSPNFAGGFELLPGHPAHLLLICQCFFSCEHIFLMRMHRSLSKPEWDGLSREITLLLGVPAFQAVWEVASQIQLHTPEFRAAVELHYATPPYDKLLDPSRSRYRKDGEKVVWTKIAY